MANNLMYGWGIDISNSPGFKRAIALQNYRAGMRTLIRYANLAGGVIRFEGLSDTMDERAMRQGFVWYPLNAIFKVGNSWINLPAVPGGRGYNPQGNFADGYAYGKNGQVFHVSFKMPGEDASDFLSRTPGPDTPGEYRGYCLRANDACYPAINTVVFYSEQISDLLSAVANVTPLMHHPINFTVNQKQRATAVKWFKELDNNIPFVFTPPASQSGGREITAEPVNLLQNGDIIKPTLELLDWFDQRCLTELGIKNMGSQVDKKGENLTLDEVNGTDTVTNIIVDNSVNLINDQIEKMGINKEPGLENFRAVKGVNNAELYTVDRPERDTMAGISTDTD